MNRSALDAFQASFGGEVLAPGDAAYDEVRSLYNAMIDKKPRMIARCRSADDAALAVNFGRDNDLLIAIRGGGHNGPGLGSCDDGLMIDFSLMKGVEVDPKARTVRVEPGCTQGDVDAVTQAHGLAVPAGIVSTTGVAGLTLGGGTGYLSRKYGLTIDNLLAADVVLADGSRVTASKDDNPDLFWALRGGGGNFGVVTSFLFQAHPASTVYAGPIFFGIEHARDIMVWYRDFLPTAPRELCTFFGMKKMPATDPFPKEHWGRPVCALVNCYNGPAKDGEAALKRLRSELPAPLMDGVMEAPFAAWQAAFDGLLPKGMQWYWKGGYVRELTDAAIDAHLQFGGNTPTGLSLMHLYPIDGAVRDVAEDATAWNCRDATWNMVIAGIDPEPANAGKIKTWARDYYEAVRPHTTGGGYVNFLMGDEGDALLKSTYGGNYDRLASIKEKYDPRNLFRVNQNIRPARSAVHAG